jgi:ribokinase
MDKIVAGLGQCSMDFIGVTDGFPDEDSKWETLPWEAHGGGPAATAMVALSRFGVRTRFMGVVSDDPAGKLIRDGFKAECVDASFIVERPGGSSQQAFILANRNGGTRTIFWARPSVAPIRPDEIADMIKGKFLDGASMLLVDGLMTESAAAVARLARGFNIPVMFDAGSIREATRKPTLELAALCDYVVCSEVFSNAFAGGGCGGRRGGGRGGGHGGWHGGWHNDTHEETLKKLLDMGAKAAAVTLGKRGSLNVSRDDCVIFHQPAFEVDAVDTTGAGDVFHAGYVYGLINGWTLRETARFASAVAAMKCRAPGGRAGIPGVLEAVEFMGGD